MNNSLWPSNATWRYRTGSTLAQVMACCLTSPRRYLNQCWFIISKVPWHTSEGIIIRISKDTNGGSKCMAGCGHGWFHLTVDVISTQNMQPPDHCLYFTYMHDFGTAWGCYWFRQNSTLYMVQYVGDTDCWWHMVGEVTNHICFSR